MSRQPIAIDPPGCACTECLVGEYVPLDRATASQIAAARTGLIEDHTNGQLAQAPRVDGFRSAAEETVARLDSCTQEEHRVHLVAALLRVAARMQAHKVRAAAAASRLRIDRPSR